VYTFESFQNPTGIRTLSKVEEVSAMLNDESLFLFNTGEIKTPRLTMTKMFMDFDISENVEEDLDA